jgi:Heparinase II/III-like protein
MLHMRRFIAYQRRRRGFGLASLPGVRAHALAWVLALIATVAACDARNGEALADPGDEAMVVGARSQAAKAEAPRSWKIEPGIALNLDYVDKRSPEFARYRRWVDLAVAGQPGYGFSAYHAALLYRLDQNEKYCKLAVQLVEAEVAAAETAIAAGNAPEIAGDSYLEVGPRIAALALTLDTCGAKVDPKQRERWSAFAQQAVRNVWHPYTAHWGGRPRPWTGWSIDNPGNNYYYSFVEATLYWALASGSEEWMRFLGEEKMPPLQAYFARLAGGGSLEGTGYGAAHMRLFALYRLWRDATGEDIANANPHATDSIAYWVHATVPTLDRFAPIGDQSRSSVPEIYDYHRRLVLEARALSQDPQAQALAAWWLHGISIERMSNGFNTLHDLLPAGDADAPAPTALHHHAVGAGHLFARSGWGRDAMWLSVVAGPYNESHAHQEQGGFTLFAGDWLAVTENIWSHSGIQQSTLVHNVLRFERETPMGRRCRGAEEIAHPRYVVPQCEPSESRMTLAPGADGALAIDADLTGAYAGNPAVKRWRRKFDFSGRRLRVEDRFELAPGTDAVFQLNLPVEPKIEGTTAIAGDLRIEVLAPAGARLSALDWRTLGESEFKRGWRLDIAGGSDAYVVELREAGKPR